MPASSSELPPPMHHVLVDFENVHEVDSAVFRSKSVSLVLLLGAKQTKLEVGLVEQLLEHASAVQLVRLTSSRKNALDFALAYYLGRAVLADPAGCFHIVSGDTGYDPLIDHLRSRHVQARRHADFTTLTFAAPGQAKPDPPAKAAPTKTAPASVPTASGDLLDRVLAHLRKNTSNRPRRRSTLARHLLSLAGKTTHESEIEVLIDRLAQAGHLKLSEKGTVTYPI